MSDREASASLRVLHVLEAARGGTTRHLVDIVRHTDGVEHHVAIPPALHQAVGSGAVYDQAGVDAMQSAGASLHYVDMRRSPWHPANAGAFTQLIRLVHRIDPVAVHTHSSVGGAIGRLAAASVRLPALYTPNGIAPGRAARAIEVALGPVTARFIAVSQSEALMAQGKRLARADRLVVIPNGIELDLLKPPDQDLRALLNIEPGTALVGTVARLVYQKAPEQFLMACAAVRARRPNTHFVLIGMGPLQAEVDEGVRRLGLGDRWHQIPYLPDAATALGQFDVFILTSRFEGGPYTPLEAMRAGTPVVLSDVVGNRDAVDPGVTGLLVPFGDATAAAEAVVTLLDDPVRRQTLAEAAVERLYREFDIKVMGTRLAELYREVAEESSRRRTRRLPHPR